jgi:hypothetical protein
MFWLHNYDLLYWLAVLFVSCTAEQAALTDDVALRCEGVNAEILQYDLDENVTIYMLGDSTIRQQWACLCHDIVFAETHQVIGGKTWAFSHGKRTWDEFHKTHRHHLGDGRHEVVNTTP